MVRAPHNVSTMRRDILTLIFAAAAAVLGPVALHFYHRAEALELQVSALERRVAPTIVLDFPLGSRVSAVAGPSPGGGR